MQTSVDRFPVVVGRRRHLVGGPADERRERGRVRTLLRGWTLYRLEEAQPVPCGRGAENAAGPVDYGGNVDFVEGVPDQRGVAVGPHQDRDVAGADPLAADGRAVVGADFDLGL